MSLATISRVDRHFLPRVHAFWDRLSKTRLEAGLWVTGVAAVAVADPRAPSLIETCVFKLVGFPRCPGCGLGHAVGFLARGEFLLSFQSHPLAILVLGVLVHRVVTLLRSENEPGNLLSKSQ